MHLLNTDIDNLHSNDFDENLVVRTFLDAAMRMGIVDAYFVTIIPQTGPEQGVPQLILRKRRAIPELITDKCLTYLENVDYSNSQKRKIIWKKFGEFFICFTSLSFHYDINIGGACFVAGVRSSSSKIHFFLDLIELIISLRKKAIALSYQPKFLELGFDTDENLDKRIGQIVHSAVSPNFTMILRHDTKIKKFHVTYSSSNNFFSVPENLTPLNYCRTQKLPAIIQDTSDEQKVVSLYGSYFFNIEYIKSNNIKSCGIFPVTKNNQSFSFVVCAFQRINAISKVETSIINDITNIMAEYYELRTQWQIVSEKIKENEKISKLVRQAILIADIMHDNSDDLMVAHGQLDMINPRTEIEKQALRSAKDSLKNLIVSARLFKRFFAGQLSESTNFQRHFINKSGYFQQINIFDLIQEVIEKFSREIEKEKIETQIMCPRNLQIMANLSNIKKAIENPVKNSIYYLGIKTNVKRKIILRAAVINDGDNKLGKSCEIIIYDNGPGIPSDFVDRVTEPFLSLRGGMGLGLSIACAACEAHGGDVEVQSEWGKFCRIRLTFPQQSF